MSVHYSTEKVFGQSGDLIRAKRDRNGDVVLYVDAIALDYADQQQGIKEYLNCFTRYSEDEPRDEDGKWTDGGGGSGGGGDSAGTAPAEKPKPESDTGNDFVSKLSSKEKDQLKIFGSGEKSWKDKGSYDKIRSSAAFGETLSKLPRSEGTFYRGMVLKSPGEIKQFAVGQTVTVSKHSFASPQRSYAKSYTQLQLNFTKGTPIVLRVNNASAANFGKARVAYGEKANKLEVVFEAGSKFTVTSMKETEFNGVKGYNVVGEYVK